jgi:hypothetical protein
VHSRCRLLLAVASALFLVQGHGMAQAPPALTRLETGNCPRCTVRLQPVAVVGHADDAELMTDYDLFGSTRDGGFVAVGQEGKHPILRYDRTGR